MKRFIVLAHPRSGSGLLVNALQQHGALRMYDEILTHSEDEAARRRDHTIAGRWLGDEDDGADFLRHVFQPQRDEAGIGFKLMHNHARRGPHATAWEWLRADRDLHVIHLRRDDLLRCVVSHLVAARTRVWHVGSDASLPAEPEPFAVSPDECRAELDKYGAWLSRAQVWIGERPLLELEYDRDLVHGFEETMPRVFAFLGVPDVPVKKGFQKIARRTPREQLANFDELAAAFAGTPFARFFQG